jgi:hypothetical protein
MNSKGDSMIYDLLQTLPYEEFYNHRDLRPLVIEAIRNDEKPFLVLLAGPGEWDTGSHPSFPLYAAYKTNSRDNGYFPPSHWQLILTAPGRDEMVILPWSESDKTPPAEASKPTPPPPGSKPKVNYSFDQDWRDVNFEGLPPGPQSWKAVVHAGNFLSNPIVFNIKPNKHKTSTVHPISTLPKKVLDYPEAVRAQFERTPLHPIAPESGVVFAKKIVPGTMIHPHLFLVGSFGFPIPMAPQEYFNLHLFLTGDDLPKGIRITLSIPSALLNNDGKTIHGWFKVDLQPFFVNSSGQLLAPKILYVTSIHGGFIGEPHLIESLTIP